MPPDLGSGLAAFFAEYRPEINALVTIALAIVLARVVDRVLSRHGRLTQAMAGGELTPGADTRLRLARRLISAVIIVVGVALALSSFESVRRVATAVLASSAVLGLIVGFAARQTIANAVAGDLARHHPADPHRRPRDLRGGDGGRRGHPPDLHLHARPTRATA